MVCLGVGAVLICAPLITTVVVARRKPPSRERIFDRSSPVPDGAVFFPSWHYLLFRLVLTELCLGATVFSVWSLGLSGWGRYLLDICLMVNTGINMMAFSLMVQNISYQEKPEMLTIGYLPDRAIHTVTVFLGTATALVVYFCPTLFQG